MFRSIALILSIVLSGCYSQHIINNRNVYKDSEWNATADIQNEKYIKVHLKDGSLAIINKYTFDNDQRLISGYGIIFGKNRKSIVSSSKYCRFSHDDCVLIETNSYEGTNVISPVLMTFTIVTSVITLPCLADPKACFGSCPTYYLKTENREILQAEGFSSSITKSMESEDIDFLPDFEYDGQAEVTIALKNEAYETHYIRKSELLILPKPEHGGVYYGDHRFFAASGLTLPVGAKPSTDSIVKLLTYNDGKEYFTTADSIDLNTKESLVIDFGRFKADSSGIVVTKRQSLMTTFLFYQSMAYMGSKAGDLMALYERSNPMLRSGYRSMVDHLGGIEISVLINNRWKPIGSINEQGPIAKDTHLLPIKYKGTGSKVKITMTKGLWRIDQIALCKIDRELTPVVVPPCQALNNGHEDPALLASLVDGEKMVVNQPGSIYTLTYSLPQVPNPVVFIRTQGYYTEWMRSEWLREEDPLMTHLLLNSPNKYLKIMAPRYKMVESEMEHFFWLSKYANGEH
jgi:hypothetical protein